MPSRLQVAHLLEKLVAGKMLNLPIRGCGVDLVGDEFAHRVADLLVLR